MYKNYIILYMKCRVCIFLNICITSILKNKNKRRILVLFRFRFWNVVCATQYFLLFFLFFFFKCIIYLSILYQCIRRVSVCQPHNSLWVPGHKHAPISLTKCTNRNNLTQSTDRLSTTEHNLINSTNENHRWTSLNCKFSSKVWTWRHHTKQVHTRRHVEFL